jgi:hypothetical protein
MRRPGGAVAAGDESGHGFAAILFDPFSRFLFGAASNFADHDDAFGFRIIIEQFNHIEMRCAVDGSPPMQHRCFGRLRGKSIARPLRR